MIRVNLLPAEYRRGNRLSSKLLGVAFGSALAVAASIGWFGIVYFGQLGELESQREEIVARLTDKKRQEAYYDKLEGNRKEYTAHVQTIQDIGKSRRVWSKLLDEIIDVVNNNGEDDRHLAWFDSMTVKSDPKNKASTITMPGAVKGSEFAKVANLHQDFERAPFRDDVASKSSPSGRIDYDKTRLPPESFKFGLQLQLKPTVVEPAKKPPVKK